jgi:hypothetical protein
MHIGVSDTIANGSDEFGKFFGGPTSGAAGDALCRRTIG